MKSFQELWTQRVMTVFEVIMCETVWQGLSSWKLQIVRLCNFSILLHAQRELILLRRYTMLDIVLFLLKLKLANEELHNKNHWVTRTSWHARAIHSRIPLLAGQFLAYQYLVNQKQSSKAFHRLFRTIPYVVGLVVIYLLYWEFPRPIFQVC